MPVLQAPFSYSVTYVPPKARKERTDVVSDVTPVQVRECKGTDAPVAVRAIRTGETKPTEYRSHEGKLWQPIRSVDASLPADVIAASDFAVNPFIPRTSPLRKANEIKARDTVAMKEIVASEKLAGTAAAQSRADELLLIDGVLHEISSGPVLYLVPSDGNKRVTLVSSDIYEDRADRASCFIFRGDERDHALAVAGALFKNPPAVDAEVVDVVIPGSLTMDSSLVSLAETAAEVFGSRTAQGTIGSLSTPYLEAFLEYTDSDHTPDLLEELLDRVSTSMGKDYKTAMAHAGWAVARRRLENVPAPARDELPTPA